MQIRLKATVVLILSCFIAHHASGQSVDYRAQTLFIYNFIKYVNWPDAKGDVFKIAVFGQSPIVEELKKLASVKKTSTGKTISVIQINAISPDDNYELIYVVDSKSKEVKNIVEAMKNKSALVVAQREGLAKKGASIDFVILEDDKLGFEVSRSQVESQKLKISGELLRLAILID